MTLFKNKLENVIWENVIESEKSINQNYSTAM